VRRRENQRSTRLEYAAAFGKDADWFQKVLEHIVSHDQVYLGVAEWKAACIRNQSPGIRVPRQCLEFKVAGN
jgi:hypothetical protein